MRLSINGWAIEFIRLMGAASRRSLLLYHGGSAWEINRTFRAVCAHPDPQVKHVYNKVELLSCPLGSCQCPQQIASITKCDLRTVGNGKAPPKSVAAARSDASPQQRVSVATKHLHRLKISSCSVILNAKLYTEVVPGESKADSSLPCVLIVQAWR